jgi:uncharacterized cysteine cluster protein YcgN (CxxCxxCC family)
MLKAAPSMPNSEELFWKNKTLEAMTPSEWESLCDGCGRCCLEKLEDEETGKLYFTNVGCRLFDGDTCTCRDYENRSQQVPDCVRLTPQNVRALNWLPPSCAYRLVAEGHDLYWWHPLVSGDPATVMEAGISVRGRVFETGEDMPAAELEAHIVQWPGRIPKKALRKPK